jgi:two-component system response regulator AtoC
MQRPFQVLIAEDEPSYSQAVSAALVSRGHEVTVCETAAAARAALRESDWDALLLDLRLGEDDGTEVLAEVQRSDEHLQTVIVTGFANTESAIRALRLGAFDYLTKPGSFDEVVARVENAAQKTRLGRQNRDLRYQVQRQIRSEIVTCSPKMNALLDTIVRVARARTPVLIEGESGVGKELVAQHLHRASHRAAATFVDLNCAAVAESLFESELFGHEKGAFTGAGNEKPGLVEVADGGTLFLDEIGEMPAETQAKLLRVLDSGSFYRVGATRKRRADFRLVAATNRSLRDAVAAGRFRQDLFYRLNGIGVVIPPLRERREDIPLLLEHFARQLPVKRRFAPSAVAALGAYAWPGNVRELGFAVERIGLLTDDEVVEAHHLPAEFQAAHHTSVPDPAQPDLQSASNGNGGPTPVRDRVVKALEQTRWHRGRAADELGVSARTLHRWMKRFGL